VPEHRAVLEAIRRHDPEAARDTIRTLIDEAERDVVEAMGEA
jgi:DNA-binding FadR family transcriptional regulator